MQGIAPSPISYHNETADENKPAEFRDAAHLAWRVEVAAALEAAGYAKVAQEFRDCADPAKIFTVDYSAALPDGVNGVFVCENDPHHHARVLAPMCRKRFCPDCAHQGTARLLNHYVPIILDLESVAAPGHSLKHVVLTTPISLDDENLREKLADLMKAVPLCFDAVTGYDWRKDSGLLFAFEFGEDGRKLHFHCIWLGAYLPHAKLVTAWHDLTNGMASIVWIEKVSYDGEGGRTLESAVAEIAKYATKLAHKEKDGSWSWLPAADVVKLHEVLKGSRRVRSYGLFYGHTPKKRPHLCPVCSGAMLKLVPLEWDIWRETGWLPDEFAKSIKPPLLNLIIGNNSGGLPPPKNNVFAPVPTALPGFEHLTHRASWEDSLK